VAGRLALLHARGALAPHETIVVESILGTRFRGRVVDTTRVGSYAAVVPEVSGRAWITGRNELFVAPDDPLGAGFLLR
jgi:proline racemase